MWAMSSSVYVGGHLAACLFCLAAAASTCRVLCTCTEQKASGWSVLAAFVKIYDAHMLAVAGHSTCAALFTHQQPQPSGCPSSLSLYFLHFVVSTCLPACLHASLSVYPSARLLSLFLSFTCLEKCFKVDFALLRLGSCAFWCTCRYIYRYMNIFIC